MRARKTESVGDLLGKNHLYNTSEKQIRYMENKNRYNREWLWSLFKRKFREITGKELDQDGDTIMNLSVVFHYFLQEDKFFDCKNLRKDIFDPSFDKGLLIIGGYGLGKTDYFRVFEAIFNEYPLLRFKYFSANKLVRDFEKCQTPLDKEHFFRSTDRKLMFIDDINSEQEASNYGKKDVIREILYNRYDCRLKTFVTCNYSTPNNCAVETVMDLGRRYGGRLYDRFHEIFNVIEFKGRSKRK